MTEVTTSMGADEQDQPDIGAIAAYLVAQRHQPRRRIVRGQISGHTVWVKRYDAHRRPVGKLLHEVISPVLPSAVLKASPRAGANKLAQREERKTELFRAAGFHAPKVLYREGALLVLSHEGPSLESLLDELRRKGDSAAHDRLLVACAVTLARLHAAGLCHGRPHKRDILVKDGIWSFIDFEEEPEAVMPLTAAQARDVWLLFFQITHAALNPETPGLAFAAYRQAAPDGVLDSLAKLVGSFRPIMPLLRFILRIRPGGDLGRLRNVTELLSSELARPPATPAATAGKVAAMADNDG
jgi:tRNA A-37 threonylcarbamoyl transferase component Bud32